MMEVDMQSHGLGPVGEEHVTPEAALEHTAGVDAVEVGALGFSQDPREDLAAGKAYETISTAGPDADAEAKVEAISDQGFAEVAANLGTAARSEMGEVEAGQRDKMEKTDEPPIVLNDTNVEMKFDVPKVDLAPELHENQPVVETAPDNVVPIRPEVAAEDRLESGEDLGQLAG